MDISYKTKKLEKICNNYTVARKEYNSNMADKIHQRIDNITAAPNVEMLISCKIGRCHTLKGDRAGQYAMDLVHPYRLVFTVKGEAIQIANIVEIADYH